jgi:hypothetical protein
VKKAANSVAPPIVIVACMDDPSSSDGRGGATQLVLEVRGPGADGARRSLRMRRVAAMLAPAATDAGAIIGDERLLEVAEALSDAYTRPNAAAGLSHAELVERLRGIASEQTIEERLGVFKRLGFLRPIRDKKHQQRYVLDPAGVVGLRVIERFGARGGLEQLLVFLERLRTQIAGRRVGPEEVRAELTFVRGTLALLEAEVRRLVTSATLAELIEERRLHDQGGLMEKLKELNDEVGEEMPELDHLAWQLVEAGEGYMGAVTDLLTRLLQEGGEAMAFEVLDAEEYLAAALDGRPGELAEAVAHVVFDPPRMHVGASEIAAALADYRPRQTIRERPPEPAGTPEADPLARYRELHGDRQRRRILQAEGHLNGASEVDLLSRLHGFGWRGARGALAALVQLDFDRDQPYNLELGGVVASAGGEHPRVRLFHRRHRLLQALLCPLLHRVGESPCPSGRDRNEPRWRLCVPAGAQPADAAQG